MVSLRIFIMLIAVSLSLSQTGWKDNIVLYAGQSYGMVELMYKRIGMLYNTKCVTCLRQTSAIGDNDYRAVNKRCGTAVGTLFTVTRSCFVGELNKLFRSTSKKQVLLTCFGCGTPCLHMQCP
ncbi:Uncharacterised protein g9620 [Pycnogonum litorale]